MIRTELFNYHLLYDVEIEGEHRYVYGLPYYSRLYAGRHIYPDGARLYELTPETYIDIIVMKQKDRNVCREYMESEVDAVLMAGGTVEGYSYLGDKKDFWGSMPSAVMQALLGLKKREENL